MSITVLIRTHQFNYGDTSWKLHIKGCLHTSRLGETGQGVFIYWNELFQPHIFQLGCLACSGVVNKMSWSCFSHFSPCQTFSDKESLGLFSATVMLRISSVLLSSSSFIVFKTKVWWAREQIFILTVSFRPCTGNLSVHNLCVSSLYLNVNAVYSHSFLMPKDKAIDIHVNWISKNLIVS